MLHSEGCDFLKENNNIIYLIKNKRNNIGQDCLCETVGIWDYLYSSRQEATAGIWDSKAGA